MTYRKLQRGWTLGSAQAILAFIIVTFVLFVAWARHYEIDEVARTSGQIIAVARTQYIQAANDGVIAELLVKEGQVVKKGDVLARLERAQSEAAVDDSRGKVAALTAAVVRLRAEVFNKPLKFPESVKAFPTFVENQKQLFSRRQRALHEEAQSLTAMLNSAQQELRVSEPLLVTGDISKLEITRLQKSIYELQGQITNRRNKYFQDAQADMTKAEEDLATQEQSLADRAAILERTEMKAPRDGVIRNIRLTSGGAKVKPGDIVMELLPTDGRLIAEAKLKPVDVAQIRPGLHASVKLDSYDYSIYGQLEGRVIYLSPDALTEDTRQGENIYYKVQIEIDDQSIAQATHASHGKKIEIQPGMTAQIDIRTGKRTVLSFLTKPVSKTMAGAFTER